MNKYFLITCLLIDPGSFSDKAKILERSTLGHQPIVLGGLFSEVEDDFLPGLALWNEETIENHKRVIDHPRQRTLWTDELDFDDRKDLLGIDADGSLSIDIDSGKIAAKGSFHYIDEEKVSLSLLIYIQ